MLLPSEYIQVQLVHRGKNGIPSNGVEAPRSEGRGGRLACAVVMIFVLLWGVEGPDEGED